MNEIVEIMAQAMHNHQTARRSVATRWDEHTVTFQDSIRGDAAAALAALNAAGYAVIRKQDADIGAQQEAKDLERIVAITRMLKERPPDQSLL